MVMQSLDPLIDLVIKNLPVFESPWLIFLFVKTRFAKIPLLSNADLVVPHYKSLNGLINGGTLV